MFDRNESSWNQLYSLCGIRNDNVSIGSQMRHGYNVIHSVV